MEVTPKKGFRGLIENWQSDLIAAVSVAMVALPLGLGIAIASDLPPMAGVTAAIIGGIVTTFFKGSHVSINGPSAGLIAVVLASIEGMNDGSGRVLSYVFAAFVMSGVLQVLLGLLRFGKFADLFHSTVVHGILAAIGVIIFTKQIHVAMGTSSAATSILETLANAVYEIPNINPFVAIISLFGLLLLIFHKKISYKAFHFLPAPAWLLILSIPFVYAFNFFESHTIDFLGRAYEVGPHLLINIPDNILDSVTFPDFRRINTLPFWISVISITLISSIESLASAKAIDKLDPYKRKSNLNKDLMSVGISTVVSGALGGFPVISVIVRSTVNVHNGAKTKWANFYHGILLLVIVFLLTGFIQKVPLAALAILLVYTGYKLAAPKVFRQVYSQGLEQLVFFVGTLYITLTTNLLMGVFGGLLLALITQLLLAKLPTKEFFRRIYKARSRLEKEEDGSYKLYIDGVANFLATIKLDKLLKQVPPGVALTVDFSSAHLVDYSIQEHFEEFKRGHIATGGSVFYEKLKGLHSSTDHKYGLRVNTATITNLTSRQERIKKYAESMEYVFEANTAEPLYFLRSFDFFSTRPFEQKLNSIQEESKNEYGWQIMDIKFEEGGFSVVDEYQTTLGLLRFPFPIPTFTIEKKVFPQQIFRLWRHKDIDYVLLRNYIKDFIVKVEDKKAMRSFAGSKIRNLIASSDVVHHLESNGEAILLFTDNLELASMEDYGKMIDFAKKLQSLVLENHAKVTGDMAN